MRNEGKEVTECEDRHSMKKEKEKMFLIKYYFFGLHLLL